MYCMKKHHANKASDINGFSLVEIVISAALLSIAFFLSADLFNNAIKNNTNARLTQERYIAAIKDAETIQVANDRYTCSNPETCSVKTSDPGEDDYYPTGSAVSEEFEDRLCKDSSLNDNLIAHIRELPQDSLQKYGLERVVADQDDNRYMVYWKDQSDKIIYRIIQTPTIAWWCP